MPTQAIAAYGTQLRMGQGTSPGAVSITSATGTAPIQITTTLHGIPVGDVGWVVITGATGMTSLNGSFVAYALSTTVLELRNSFPNAPYTGGGFATIVDTFFLVAELVNITPIGVQFNMVDTSAHDGDGWGSAIPTFKSGPDMRLELNSVPDDPTHDHLTGLLGMALSGIRRPFLIVLPDAGKSTVAFRAWVSDHGTQTPFDGVLRANPVLSVDGELLIALGPVVEVTVFKDGASTQTPLAA